MPDTCRECERRRADTERADTFGTELQRAQADLWRALRQAADADAEAARLRAALAAAADALRDIGSGEMPAHVGHHGVCAFARNAEMAARSAPGG